MCRVTDESGGRKCKDERELGVWVVDDMKDLGFGGRD